MIHKYKNNFRYNKSFYYTVRERVFNANLLLYSTTHANN